MFSSFTMWPPRRSRSAARSTSLGFSGASSRRAGRVCRSAGAGSHGAMKAELSEDTFLFRSHGACHVPQPFSASHVIARQRHVVLPAGELDAENYLIHVSEGYFAARQIELPHPAEAVGTHRQFAWSVLLRSVTAVSRSSEEPLGALPPQRHPRLVTVRDPTGTLSIRPSKDVRISLATAVNQIADARTVEPVGIALKLRAISGYRDDDALLHDLNNGDTRSRAIASIIRDLEAQPEPATTPAALYPHQLASAIVDATLPVLDKEGNIVNLKPLAEVLMPFFGHFTVADGVAALGLLRTSAGIFRDGATQQERDRRTNAMRCVCILLEEFCSRALGSGRACTIARALLLRQAAEDDAWSLGEDLQRVATFRLHSELCGLGVGETFASFPRSPTPYIRWLSDAMENRDESDQPDA